MPETPATPTKPFSIAALATGIIGAVLIIVFLVTNAEAPIFWAGSILALAAVVLGIIALKKPGPKGLAVTGLVIGAVFVLVAVVMFTFTLAFLGFFTP